jgi:hypothetical protein
MNLPAKVSERHRYFKLFFVPLLVFSLATQLAVVWSQLVEMRNGYFDFVLYYSGAQILKDGNGYQLYNLDVQREYQERFRRKMDRDLPFNHLPYELLPLVSLAGFSFPVAYALWAAINILLLAIMLLRIFPFVEARQRSLLTLMVLAYFPTLTTLKMGQDSIITTLLLAETFVSLKHKRYAIAGAVLALGLYKPQFFLPLLGILLLHGRWGAIVGFSSMALLLGIISQAMVGWKGLMGLLSLWLPMIDRGNVVWPELMMNLRGLLYVGLDLAGLSQITNILTLVLSLLIYMVVLRLWPREAEEPSDLLDLRFALSIAATALISFHLYSYDGTMLVLPLVLTLNHLLKQTCAYPVSHRVFFAVLIVWFVPFLPNLLLHGAMFAWWALPLPVFWWVLAREIKRRSVSESVAPRI